MLSKLRDLRPTQLTPKPLGGLVAPYTLTQLTPKQAQIPITGVSMDSCDIAPGELFVAVPGQHFHGASFSAKAVQAGAAAIVTDETGALELANTPDFGSEQLKNTPIIVVNDPRALAGELACLVYENPSQKLKVFGVTGTNGKTTTTFLLRSIFKNCGYKVGLLGTVEIQIGQRIVEAKRTTVEAPVLQRLLALAVEEGTQVAVVETSSHALDLHRVKGMHYNVAGFTNLQHEHLDYHHDMASYFEAKSRLFAPEMSELGVISLDDEWGQLLHEKNPIPHLTVRTPLSKQFPMLQTDRPGPNLLPNPIPCKDLLGVADFVATDIKVDAHRGITQFTLHTEGQSFDVSIPFLGDINVQNACVALAMAHQEGLDLEASIEAIAKATPVPGRLQRVGGGKNLPLALIDYAHTAEALDKMLSTVRGFSTGKLHIVMGSDGQRDSSKRPLMGQAVAKWGDYIWLTDENPRFEDPAQIRAQILEGMKKVRPDLRGIKEVTTCRRDAVRQAMLHAQPGDTVIATGKGTEPYQEIEGVLHHYLDSDVMLEVLEYLRKKQDSDSVSSHVVDNTATVDYLPQEPNSKEPKGASSTGESSKRTGQ